MKRALILGLALAALIVAIVLVLADYYDPAPVDTPTKACEPIGAQHPKAQSAECKP